MSTEQKIDLVLEFPEGDFLITSRKFHAGNGAYFMQPNSDTAYLGWGRQKELMGKVHRRMPTRSEKFDEYDVTYEIEDDELLAARLITPFSKSAGKLASDEKVQKLNDALQNGSLELKGKYNPPALACAATLSTGETLLVVSGLTDNNYETLFIGQPGNYQEYELGDYCRGGNRTWYTVKETGKKLVYDYLENRGSYEGELPNYDGDLLNYLKIDDRNDLSKFGLEVDQPHPHLDPFCPELVQP